MMNEKITISIVMPSFNQGKFIEDSIKSILSQEGNFFIDLIIMDGGSTDNSVDVIKKNEDLLKKNCTTIRALGLLFHVKKNKNFRYCNCLGISYRWFSEKDRGQTHALNKCLKIIKGEFFNWMNTDDFYSHNKVIKTAVDFLQNNSEYDMIYGRGYCTDENKVATRDFNDNCSTLCFNRDILKRECFILEPSVFLRSKIFNEVGIFDESLHWCMDWEMWLRISLKFKVTYIPHWMAYFRQYEGIKTTQHDFIMFKERYSVSKRYSTFIEFIFSKWFYLPLYPRYLRFTTAFKYKYMPLKIFFYGIVLSIHYIFRIIAKFHLPKAGKRDHKRIAIFSPMAPLKSRTVKHLNDFLKSYAKKNPDIFVDIFVDDGYTPKNPRWGTVRVMNHKYFPMNSFYYDSVLYELGNNFKYHSYMAPYIKKYGGTVVIHDAAIEKLFNGLMQTIKDSIMKCNVPEALKYLVLFPEIRYYLWATLFIPKERRKNFLKKYFYKKSSFIKKAEKVIVPNLNLIDKLKLSRNKYLDKISDAGGILFPND